MLLTEAEEARKVNCGDDMSALPTAASYTRFAHFCTTISYVIGKMWGHEGCCFYGVVNFT